MGISINVHISGFDRARFGVGSVFFNRRLLSFAPVFLVLGVLGLMVYAGYTISPSPILGGYQQGYYLIFPSLALYTFAFILNEVTKKQQTKDSISV